MTRVFRRALSITSILILCALALFAADDVKRITAYKQGMKGTLPLKSVSIRGLTAVGEDITHGQQMILSENFRNTSLPGFSWILSGNVFGKVNVSFEFGQLKHVDTSLESNNLIYYKVQMKHTDTKIGNASVIVGKTPTNESGLRRQFMNTNYYLIYADDVTGDVNTSFDVKNADVTKSVSYDLSTRSLVFQKSGSNYNTMAASNFKTQISSDSQTQNICEYWNRYGSVSILLDVYEDTSGATTVYKTNNKSLTCNTGWYSADVTITLSVV